MVPYRASLNIANNAAITTEFVDARFLTEFGVTIPATFTSTTIGFSVSDDGSTFGPLYDSANALVSVTVTAGRRYQLPATVKAWPYFKITTGGNEAAARVLILVAK